jgi:hypothetical protein
MDQKTCTHYSALKKFIRTSKVISNTGIKKRISSSFLVEHLFCCVTGIRFMVLTFSEYELCAMLYCLQYKGWNWEVMKWNR